jgi:hypothetical protein
VIASTEYQQSNHRIQRPTRSTTIAASLPLRQRRGAATTTPGSLLVYDDNNEHPIMEDFDALKREATKLERHLEEKVAKYQQVCTYV